jgi:hypothetical protein
MIERKIVVQVIKHINTKATIFLKLITDCFYKFKNFAITLHSFI